MPGSEHIASEASRQYLAACLRLFKPAKVLEMGAGIGTITETVLSHPCGVSELLSTEANPFCLKSLRESLRDFEAGRLTEFPPVLALRMQYFRMAALVLIEHLTVDTFVWRKIA